MRQNACYKLCIFISFLYKLVNNVGNIVGVCENPEGIRFPEKVEISKNFENPATVSRTTLQCCIAAYKICKYTVQFLLPVKLLETRILRTVWPDVNERVNCVLSTWTLYTLLSSIAEKFGKLGRVFQTLCEFNKD